MKGNVLVLKDLPKNSKWCDKDKAMLYACFQLLIDFLEKEKPQNFVDYNHDKKQRRQWKEFKALYRYWNHTRPKLERKIQTLISKWAKSRKTKWISGPIAHSTTEIVLSQDKKTWNLLRKTEDQFKKQEEEMLGRLIAVRRHLWC